MDQIQSKHPTDFHRSIRILVRVWRPGKVSTVNHMMIWWNSRSSPGFPAIFEAQVLTFIIFAVISGVGIFGTTKIYKVLAAVLAAVEDIRLDQVYQDIISECCHLNKSQPV